MGGFFRRRGFGIFLPAALLAFFSPGVAEASSYIVIEESEWTFTLDQAQTVYIYGNSNRACGEPGSDPYLWLYDSNGTLVAQDDDGNHNSFDQCVSSKIVNQLDAGDYTVYAGYCCSKYGIGSNPSGYPYELVITDVELQGGPATTTTTTTELQSIGPPINLTGELTEQGVFLDWDAPDTGNVQPERYAIAFRIPPGGGWGVATGNVGDENALITEYTLSYDLFESTGGLGEEYVFDIRSDNDTLGLYSGWSTQVTLTVERVAASTTTTTTTTTTSSTTTTTTSTTTTTTSLPPQTTTTSTSSTTTLPEVLPSTTSSTSTTTTTSTVPPPPPVITPPETTTSTTTTTTTSPPTTTTPSSTTTAPPTTTTTISTTSTLPIAETTTTVASTVESTVAVTTVPETTSPPTSPLPLPPVSTSVKPAPVTTSVPSTTTTSTTTSSTTTTATTTSPPTTTVPRTPTTAPTTTATTVPESPVLEKIDDPVVKAALEAVIVEEITPEAIETLASIDFDSLDQETLDAVSVALSDAPTEIKEQFEEEIDIFDGEFDEYVPVGSTVPVRTRRVIVVATTAMFVLPSPRSNSGGKR